MAEQNNNASSTEEVRLPPVNMRTFRIMSIWFVRFFFVLLFSCFILSLIIPLRPKYSESEKRELAKFPKFTFTALVSGKYFDGINSWYSDTFPLREKLTDINAFFTGLYGKSDVRIQGDVETGDDIPESHPDDSSGTASDTSSAASSAESSEPSKADGTSSASSSAPSEAPKPQTPAQTQTTQTLGALLINGDTAYEYYNFVRGTADLYTSAINRAGTLLAGKTNVYDMIVPTSMGITAPDNVVATINTSDQKKAINYMYSGMGKSGVKTVSIYDTLKARRNEYIFFRTDHHWTALGAYYAYCDFIKATGGTPAALDSFIVHQFPNYLGSFYTSSKKLPQLAANPDTVFAYQPKETNSMQIYFSVGGPAKTEPIISDMTNVSSKYLTFIKGDRPFSIINNPAKNDGSVCVLVKESFGNAFAPLLVPNYQTVYIVDYRYFSGTVFGGKTYNSIPQLCIDVKAKDLLFLNNISATRNKDLVNSINALIK